MAFQYALKHVPTGLYVESVASHVSAIKIQAGTQVIVGPFGNYSRHLKLSTKPMFKKTSKGLVTWLRWNFQLSLPKELDQFNDFVVEEQKIETTVCGVSKFSEEDKFAIVEEFLKDKCISSVATLVKNLNKKGKLNYRYLCYYYPADVENDVNIAEIVNFLQESGISRRSFYYTQCAFAFNELDHVILLRLRLEKAYCLDLQTLTEIEL